jgi:diaminopimelate epimerase
MKFTKMHGLGNDYVYVDCHREHVEDPPTIARSMSDRHTGIGGDGLILIKPSDRADVRMEIYNADGSRAQMCGNGIRCVAKYAVEHGLAAGPGLRVETDDGIKLVACSIIDGTVRLVRVDIGVPALASSDIPSTIDAARIIDYALVVGGQKYMVTCVSMGNPHAVVFVDDPGAVTLDEIGPAFEHAPEFPQRINVHFVRVDGPTHATARTWERGSGITLACGTGACAICVAGVVTKRTQRKLTVTLPGGDLDVDWADNDHVYMTGPSVEVFTGEWPS